ncbi:MAG TPA: fasciclin domain-containing protein [Fibrella sp.]|jgi:uncharacterized surface protein with fasciclin (FAS1) repeats
MKRLALSLVILLTLGLSCKKTDDPVDAQPKTASDLLTETASFSLFKAAVQLAGLNDALKATNLTVLAPTDDAFKAKGFSTPESLKNIPAGALENIIRYHLITGVVTTKTPEVVAASNLRIDASNTSTLFLTNGPSGFFVNGNKVAKPDQVVANGVIHTIGALLSPPTGNAVTALRNRADVGLLVAAITRAAIARPELLSILSGTSTNPSLKQITFFAPNDAALTAAGYRNTTDINNASPTSLANLISYHIIQGVVFSNQLQAGQVTTLSTSGANKLTIAVPSSGPTVKGNGNATGVPIREADVVSQNAIIHVINQVLLP